MKNIIDNKLRAVRFVRSSNSSIKKFGYTYFYSVVKRILERNDIFESRILSNSVNVNLLIEDLTVILPEKLLNQLCLSDLFRSEKIKLAAFKKLCSRKYLSNKFLHYVQEVEQLYDMKNRLVGGKYAPYLSHRAVNRVQEQEDSNRKFLSNMLPESMSVDSFLSKQEKAKNNAFYQQLKALEDISIERDYDVVFITVVASVEHHSNTYDGVMHHTWNGSSVRDVHDKFSHQFKLHRNYLYRRNMSFNIDKAFNVKSVEPTKSGCPHYHIAVFCHKSLTSLYIDSYRKYFKNEFSNFKFKRFSASKLERKIEHNLSYVINYLVKDCFLLESTPNPEKCKRVIYWRKYNRIRAFSVSGIKGKFSEYKKRYKERVYPDSEFYEKLDIGRFVPNLSFKMYLLIDVDAIPTICGSEYFSYSRPT
ncbi:hypothetical protein EK599_20000 [Vibrio sp. T187]|uniref:replication endonuclease n=1 Tax=Vibrio TaxID=662 RepID=UPI0010C9FCC1|nr:MULTISPECIES: replication endonuclease [Vibrio]MBW3697970.1 hypothetical protein [Vibrio sp. T187]